MEPQIQFEVDDVVALEIISYDGNPDHFTSKRVFGTVVKVNEETITVLRADTNTHVDVNKNDYTLVRIPIDKSVLTEFSQAFCSRDNH